MHHCPACQAPLLPEAAFCHMCGTAINVAATGPTQRLTPPDDPALDDAFDDIRKGLCPKCGSEQILPGRFLRIKPAESTYISGTIQIEQFERPEAWFNKGASATGSVRAWVCGECGYTELYTRNYRELYEVYRRAQDERGRRDG